MVPPSPLSSLPHFPPSRSKALIAGESVHLYCSLSVDTVLCPGYRLLKERAVTLHDPNSQFPVAVIPRSRPRAFLSLTLYTHSMEVPPMRPQPSAYYLLTEHIPALQPQPDVHQLWTEILVLASPPDSQPLWCLCHPLLPGSIKSFLI